MRKLLLALILPAAWLFAEIQPQSSSSGTGATVAVTGGGTGLTSVTESVFVYGAGASPLLETALLGNGGLIIGTGGVPSTGTLTGIADETTVVNTPGGITIGITDPLIVGKGGTGAATQTSRGVLLGQGTSAITATAAGAANAVLMGQGAGSDPVFSSTPTLTATFQAPQFTQQTSGNGTYTVPLNTKYLMIEVVGGGGGGQGGGTGSPGAGTSGANSTFSVCTSSGGADGASGGAGGAASGGDINVAGNGAGIGGLGTATQDFGGNGGSSLLGLGGGNSGINAGGTAASGFGGGGGGGGASVLASGFGGGGGGYCKELITSPATSYAYQVGAAGSGGAAGTSGQAGAGGTAGVINVWAYFQ